MQHETRVGISWPTGLLVLLDILLAACGGSGGNGSSGGGGGSSGGSGGGGGSPGTTWTLRMRGAPALYSIAHVAGQFVAVGFDGAILTSSDGVSWTSRSSGIIDLLRGIAYGSGRFVAVGEGVGSGGTLLTSP